MKCIKHGNDQKSVVRVSDAEAAKRVAKGWHYTTKAAWKANGRKMER